MLLLLLLLLTKKCFSYCVQNIVFLLLTKKVGSPVANEKVGSPVANKKLLFFLLGEIKSTK